MVKGQHCRLRDLTLKAAISMLFLILFSCLRFSEYGCQLFNATGITSFRLLELTLCTKHLLKVKSVNYLQFTPFCIFHPKVPSKHKTKNIKAFYIYNIGKTIGKYGWNYQIIWLHHIILSLLLTYIIQPLLFHQLYYPYSHIPTSL
jgi:hypothetical protein